MGASVRFLDKTGGTTNPSQDWGYINAGASSTATKFFIENNGDRSLTNVFLTITQIGFNDGFSMGRIAIDTSTVISPYGIILVASGTGGVFSATGLWYYKITATNATGETTGSIEKSVDVTATTQKVTLNWSAPIGATGYKIYRSQISGSYTTPSLLTTIASGAIVTFIDDGTAVGAGALPVDNTTAGSGPNYGTAPAMGAAPISVGTLAIGQSYVFWLQITVSASADENDNPRTFRVVPTEN